MAYNRNGMSIIYHYREIRELDKASARCWK
jgi:hypothetical protein